MESDGSGGEFETQLEFVWCSPTDGDERMDQLTEFVWCYPTNEHGGIFHDFWAQVALAAALTLARRDA